MSQCISDEPNRTDEIERFLHLHTTDYQLHNPPVKEMRHVIPLFLMEVYGHGSYTKKIKGLWEKCPDDWPTGVPFVDPNNKLKNEGEKNCKPKKELLDQMLKYLIMRYKEKRTSELASPYGFVGHNLPDCGILTQAQISLVESDEMPSVPIGNSFDHRQPMSTSSVAMSSGSYVSIDQACFPLDLDVNNLCGADDEMLDLSFLDDQLFGDMPGSVELVKPPEQVMDNEDTNTAEDWDPLAELIQRILKKLSFMKKQKFIDGTNFQSLENRYYKLKKAAIASTDRLSILRNLHSLNLDIDIQKLSCRASSDIFGQFLKKLDEPKNEILFKHGGTKPSPVEVPLAAQGPALMNSLNIKSRRGGPPPDQVELRSPPGSSSEAENTGTVNARTLSENFKPIQPTEDDIQTLLSLLDEISAANLDKTSSLVEDKMSVLNISDSAEAPTNKFLTGVQETSGVIGNQDVVFDLGSISASSLHSILPSVGNQGVDGAGVVSFALNGAPDNFTISSSGSLQYWIQQPGYSLTSVQPETVMVQSSMAVTQPPMLMTQPTKFMAQPMVMAQPPVTMAQPPKIFITQPSNVIPTPTMTMAESPMTIAQPPKIMAPPSTTVAQPQMIMGQPQPFSTGFQSQTRNNEKQMKPGGKRVYMSEDDDTFETEAVPSHIVPNPGTSFGTQIPTMVEEMSNTNSMPSSRSVKKPRRIV